MQMKAMGGKGGGEEEKNNKGRGKYEVLGWVDEGKLMGLGWSTCQLTPEATESNLTRGGERVEL